ncbi:MAG: ABC transporter permease [Lachnospiraceae bacterium]|nr:ABC transporter permease [Lachnospiraceae bacterium]
MKDKKSSAAGNTVVSVILAALLPLAAILIWILSAETGRLNTHIIASPQKLLERISAALADGSLSKNVLASTGRVLKGFAIGSALGLVVGALNGLIPLVRRLLVAVIGILRPIPPISLIPFFILWMGIGEKSKLTIIAIGAFWSVLLNTIQGFQDTDPKLLELARVFGKNRMEVLFRIILPSALPSIFTGLRLGISHAWTAVVTAEMIAASSGVGYMIQFARELAQPDLLLLGIACIGVIGLIIDTIMVILLKKIVYWRKND